MRTLPENSAAPSTCDTWARVVIPAQRALLVLLFSLLGLQVTLAQSTVASNSPSETGKSSKMVGPAESASNVVRLDAFQVSSSDDIGFFSKNTMAGTRSNERLINIPQNIQIINRELIQDLAQDNPIDVAKYGSSGVNMRTSLLGDMFIRGFRVRGFLKDNVPFGGNINVPLYDIDRMEIVKGPAALLFGQASSTGGLMNFVTKRPSKSRMSTVSATFGSFDFYRAQVNSTGPVGLPETNYRVTVGATEANGPRRFEYFKDRFVGFSIENKITPTALLSVDYSYYFRDQILSSINATTNGELTKVPDDFSFFENWVDGPNHYHYASVSLKNDITPSLNSNFVLNFNQMDTDWNRININGLTNASTGIANRTYQNVFQGNKNVTLLIDFVKSFSTGTASHKFSFGGIATEEHNFGVADSVILPPLSTTSPVYGTPFPIYERSVRTPGNPAPSNSEGMSRQASGYLQDQISLFDDRLILVGGVRYNAFHSAGTNKITEVVSTRNDHHLVKRWGAVVKPISSVSLYYNYSESFSFNSGTFLGGPRDGEQLKPSLGINKEVGVKMETSDGRLFGSIAAFDLSRTNVVVLFQQPGGIGGIDQRGTETNKGYEADIGTYFETPVGPFQAILTYYKGDQKGTNGLIPNGVVNDTWSAYLSQAIAVGPAKGLKFGFGAYHKGNVPFANAAGQLIPFVAPSYTTTTAMIAYGRENYRISINVDNVFAKKYIEGGENAAWLYTHPGRTFKFNVEYSF